MQVKNILKIAGFNIGIAIADTLFFSPGLLNIQIGGTNPFSTAFGITAIMMSISIFAYGNYQHLMKKRSIISITAIQTEEDCIHALEQNLDKAAFREEIRTILAQAQRLNKKKEALESILLQKFSPTEISYAKFEGAIQATESLFFTNTKSIINKLNAFDDDEYAQVLRTQQNKKTSIELIQPKLDIFNEYISFVNHSVKDNEEILLKLDKLLLEISKLDSLAEGELEHMGAMQEIDELINRTRLYK